MWSKVSSQDVLYGVPLFWLSNLKNKNIFKNLSLGHPGTFPYQSSQHPDSEVTEYLGLAEISPERKAAAPDTDYSCAPVTRSAGLRVGGVQHPSFKTVSPEASRGGLKRVTLLARGQRTLLS